MSSHTFCEMVSYIFLLHKKPPEHGRLWMHLIILLCYSEGLALNHNIPTLPNPSGPRCSQQGGSSELSAIADPQGCVAPPCFLLSLWSSFRFQLRSTNSHLDVSQKLSSKVRNSTKAAMCGVFSHSPCSDLAVVSHIQPTNLWTILDRTASLLIIFAASLPPRNKMVRACASIFWSNSLLARSCEGFVSFQGCLWSKLEEQTGKKKRNREHMVPLGKW